MSATVAAPVALVPREARTWDDALALLAIRNSCAAYMTGDPHQLTVAQQREWWYSSLRLANAIWLFHAPDGQAVGFGLLRMVGFRWFATLGLLPDWRGQGHGTAIYRHLIGHCPGDLYIDVLLTNGVSARAAHKAGFVLCDWSGAVATLVARRGER